MRRRLNPHLDYFCVAVLLILAYVLFFHDLDGLGFLGPDEPRYAGVAREMFESGDFVTPRLMGEEWFEKPVLMYWLASLGYAIFGIGETGARLPSALAATVSMLALYWCGRRLYSRRTGMAAALILGTSAGAVGLGRAATMDMLLAGSMTVALALFLVAQNTADPVTRRRYLYLFYAVLGLGVLAKGPVAIVLPTSTLAIFLVWRAGTGEWRRWHLEGVVITALVAAPWYIAVTWRHGWAFIDEFVIGHNLERFTMDAFGHAEPFYFYVPVLLLMIFPWTFLLLPAIGRRLDKSEHLMLAWAVVPFLFFSMSGSKLPAYILPVVAPVALLLAGEVTRTESSRRFRLAVAAEACVWLGMGVVAAFFADVVRVELPFVSPAGVLAVCGAVAAGLIIIAWAGPPTVLGFFNVATVVILILLVSGLVFPNAQAVESMRPWVTVVDARSIDFDEIVLYKPPRWMEYGLEYYLDHPATVVASERELLEITESGTRLFCVAEMGGLDELSASDRIAIEVVEAAGSQAAFWAWQP